MLSQTRRALEEFDNQHDFERLSADVLNALGYQAVEPMAPAGGPDGGCDIRFREGDAPGIAFVTLEKRLPDKFAKDLGKQSAAEGVIALFSNQLVSPSAKLAFAREALGKGYRLEVFDLERLRSLLDGSLREIRRRYLGIDDDVAARLRADVSRLLRFPSATPDVSEPATMIETVLADQMPRRVFNLLMAFDERDVREVPSLGPALHEHLTSFYRFRERAIDLESRLLLKIGTLEGCRFPAAWRIQLRYALQRFGGASQEQIISWGSFLNYGITWESAENVWDALAKDACLSTEVSDLFELHTELSKSCKALGVA